MACAGWVVWVGAEGLAAGLAVADGTTGCADWVTEKQRVPQVGLLQKQVVGLMEQKAWLPEKEPG